MRVVPIVQVAQVLLVVACGGGAPAAPRPAPTVAPVAPAAPVELVRAGSIAAGERHACAVLASGHVACWGAASGGALGTPGDREQPMAIEVPGLADVAGVAAGMSLTCAWTLRGTAWCWGGDMLDDESDHAPRRVAGLDDIIQIVVDGSGACGLHRAGTVTCWERVAWEEPLWPTPEPLPGIAGAVELAGGPMRLCARTATGVTCRLQAGWRQLPELGGATSLAGFDGRFAALLPGHRLATFELGQIEGTTSPVNQHPIHTLIGVAGTRVVAGGGIHRSAVCAIGGPAPGTTCWASGDPDRGFVAGISDLAIGGDVSCGRVGDRLWCWGLRGRLGDGEPELPVAFVPVKGIADARQLEVQFDTACVVRATGRVACWGGRFATRDKAGKDVVDVEPVELAGVADASEIGMAFDRVCARRARGRVTCWLNDRDRDRVAADEPALAGAVQLLSGQQVCGVLAAGNVVCLPVTIGTDFDYSSGLTTNLQAGRPCAPGQHGDILCWHGAGPITSAFTQNYGVACTVTGGAAICNYAHDPARTFEALAGIRDIVSWDGTYAVRRDGTVTTRGLVDKQPLGPEDAPVDQLANVVELRAGSRSVCARMTTGAVACWGQRDYLGAGQLGSQGTPARVAGVVLGPARPYAAAAPRPPVVPPPAGKPIELRGVAMAGPFPDRERACEVQQCGRGLRRDCRTEGARPMATPPAPFTEAGMLSIDCRDPAFRRDDAQTYRMLVHRADGYWVSAPLFTIGGNEKYCAALAETRWATRDLVAGGTPEIALSVVAATHCRGTNGSSSRDALALVIAVGNATRPVTYPAIPTASAVGTDVTRLDAVFAADGTLAVGGPATWVAPMKATTGAFATFRDATKRAPTPLGTYRFR